MGVWMSNKSQCDTSSLITLSSVACESFGLIDSSTDFQSYEANKK